MMITPSTPLWLRIRASVSSTSDALFVVAAAMVVAPLSLALWFDRSAVFAALFLE